MDFDYEADFDCNGVLYWLGTKRLTTPWRNPGQLGIVEVSSSPLAPEPKSSAVWAVTGREAVRCVTLPSQESWFTIDLKEFYCRPTHYTLRHYSSWDTEAVRDWKLQGSNDGKKWSKIISHKKDASLNKKGYFYYFRTALKSFCLISFCAVWPKLGRSPNRKRRLGCSGFCKLARTPTDIGTWL